MSIPAQKPIYGVSFSSKQCRNFGLNEQKTLKWLIKTGGFSRFRLMSYWNEHEKQPGLYDFADLDKQIRTIKKAGGHISLCLGARQPRWPENHWPQWAWELSYEERTQALLAYITIVVNRYKKYDCITSYQLENEALITDFGEKPEVNRQRLRDEYNLVKHLDASRPIVMTTSTSWGVPVRLPNPDVVGFSFYHTLYQNGRYKHSLLYPWVHRLRRFIIWALHRRPIFIHELQLEPWGPTAIWKMPVSEQDKSMNTEAIGRNLALANRIGNKHNPDWHIDLWGAEWWYWRYLQGDKSIWHAVEQGMAA